MRSFSQETLEGRNQLYSAEVERLGTTYGFDFTAVGLAALPGAPLKWIYSQGSTSNRFRRIMLAPGHGIGGIVLKAGKPMLFTDIDTEMDPREYSSYPIVFAEDLRSFCALPLCKGDRTVGVLLMAFRTAEESHSTAYRAAVRELEGCFCDLRITAQDFMDFEEVSKSTDAPLGADRPVGMTNSSISLTIAAQESERARISREIHDGISQELAIAAMKARLALARSTDPEQKAELTEACSGIDLAIDRLHDLSVELRPSTLDHFGLLPALRSLAMSFEKAYGARIEFGGDAVIPRFSPAMETQVYRICQEAMLNASKYADADTMEVTLTASDGWILAVVQDHGTGFNTDAPVIRGSGCGLHGMRERAELINAELTIESGPQGTRVALTAPMGAVQEGE
ncbi:MAG: GAF domain-containing sensor histidine kinase [Coriobacteriia bacterium]|nr:GAF domain-containing sensor histidine kinase [Coriobacteriia bacterium]